MGHTLDPNRFGDGLSEREMLAAQLEGKDAIEGRDVGDDELGAGTNAAFAEMDQNIAGVLGVLGDAGHAQPLALFAFAQGKRVQLLVAVLVTRDVVVGRAGLGSPEKVIQPIYNLVGKDMFEPVR